MSAANTTPLADKIPVAQQDWFSIACGILAPGTELGHIDVHAISWDAFDKLEPLGWEYKSWWVDADSHKVGPGALGARLHEQRTLHREDGATVSCYPPQMQDRPDTMVCVTCMGRGWRLVTDEDGDPHQDECPVCEGSGKLDRPTDDPAWAIDPADFAPPATEGSLEDLAF